MSTATITLNDDPGTWNNIGNLSKALKSIDSRISVKTKPGTAYWEVKNIPPPKYRDVKAVVEAHGYIMLPMS